MICASTHSVLHVHTYKNSVQRFKSSLLNLINGRNSLIKCIQKTNKQKEKQCGLTNRQITDFHEYYLKRIHVNPEYREKKS